MAGRTQFGKESCESDFPRLMRRSSCGFAGGTTGASQMEFQDRLLKCIDCGSEFLFTAGEQLFFHDKQFKNEPKRCKPCKTKRATAVGASPANSYQKVETRTTCSHCGKETTVPFKPTQGRPVFCRECFQQRRAAGATA